MGEKTWREVKRRREENWLEIPKLQAKRCGFYALDDIESCFILLCLSFPSPIADVQYRIELLLKQTNMQSAREMQTEKERQLQNKGWWV